MGIGRGVDLVNEGMRWMSFSRSLVGGMYEEVAKVARYKTHKASAKIVRIALDS